MSELLTELGKKLYDGDAPGVVELTKRALDEGMTALEVLNGGLLPGMEEVGKDFRDGELFIPEVIVAARAMHASLEILKPLLAAATPVPVYRSPQPNASRSRSLSKKPSPPASPSCSPGCCCT